MPEINHPYIPKSLKFVAKQNPRNRELSSHPGVFWISFRDPLGAVARPSVVATIPQAAGGCQVQKMHDSRQAASGGRGWPAGAERPPAYSQQGRAACTGQRGRQGHGHRPAGAGGHSVLFAASVCPVAGFLFHIGIIQPPTAKKGLKSLKTGAIQNNQKTGGQRGRFFVQNVKVNENAKTPLQSAARCATIDTMTGGTYSAPAGRPAPTGAGHTPAPTGQRGFYHTCRHSHRQQGRPQQGGDRMTAEATPASPPQ